MTTNEEQHENLVMRVAEFLLPHVDTEVGVEWYIDAVPVAYLSFSIEGVKYNISIEEEI